jgi:hypothetical protein
MATSLSPDPAEPVPKWTPGESNDREVAEDAEIAEESLLAKDSSTSLPTEPRAINRMIKRLRKRQVDMEKKGLDSTLVVEKLAALMSTKLGLSPDLQASSSAARSSVKSTPSAVRKPFEAASASMLARIPGHAEVTDVSSVMSLLDRAFGSSSNAATSTSTSTSTPVVVGSSKSSKSSNTLPSTSGKQVRKGDKEAIVFGTPEKTQSLKPFPDNLPKFQDNFPDVNDAALYQSRPHLTTQLPLPYHHQAQRDFGKFSPWIPTVDEAKRLGLKLPDMRLQRATYEHSDMNLKLHLCNAVFEAYSASYLTTKSHILEIPSETYNLTWVNCEMASFIHMKESSKFYATPDASGIIVQSLDVLDFSVIHLSAFERSSKRYRGKLWAKEQDRRTKWHNIDEVIRTGLVLQRLNDPKYAHDARYQHHVQFVHNETVQSKPGATTRDSRSSSSRSSSSNKASDDAFHPERFAPLTTRRVRYSAEANRTVVIMPFLGGAMGAGHSELGNRFEYLKTCFWSLYEFFPHIVAAVTRPDDVTWAMEHSGLPFFDMLLLENLPKSAGLPVGSMQRTKYLLQHDPIWSTSFDFVFFTESDQILISRELQSMYAHLQKYPRHMLLPHRLMPYSADAMVKGLGRKDILQDKVTSASSPKESDWMKMSCCLPRQNCNERKTWKHLSDPAVPIVNYYGLYVPLGNVNFLDEKYRACTLTPYVGDYCP